VVNSIYVEKSTDTLENVLDNGLMNSAWPMSCHDLHHTSRSPYSTADNPGGEKWRFQTGGSMESGMVIDNDGVIYFGELGNNLYAVYPDGTLKWKYQTNGWIWSTPAIAEDGTVYIGSYDDYLYAINSYGTLKWKYCSRSSIDSSPAIDNDGVIYFGNMGWPDGDGCKIFALYPNGTLKWEYQTGDTVLSDPAIGDDGTIYIGSWDNYLYAMNPDGTLKWRFKTNGYVKSHPSIADDGTIYFCSFDHYLYALNPDGSLKWKYSGSRGGSSSTALGIDGTIYVAGIDSLLAINPDGTNKWSCPLGSDIDHSSPVIDADGIIYTGVSGGEIISVNPDGTERWRKKIGNDGVYSSPCIGSNGEVYIGSSCDALYIESYGYLHCFAPQEHNHPPDTPYIGGRTEFEIGTNAEIFVESNDPDNNPISFLVDWDDGTDSGWQYDFPYMITQQDSYIRFLHKYTSMGSYNIKVKARDDFGGESDWGTFKITVSKNRAINFILLLMEKLISNLF
jgi:outer membrane protein assembly factor BamB